MIFKETISDMIFYYEKQFQIWLFIMKKKMIFKEIISNMILEKEFLKKQFQIWFFIMKHNDF